MYVNTLIVYDMYGLYDCDRISLSFRILSPFVPNQLTFAGATRTLQTCTSRSAQVRRAAEPPPRGQRDPL